MLITTVMRSPGSFVGFWRHSFTKGESIFISQDMFTTTNGWLQYTKITRFRVSMMTIIIILILMLQFIYSQVSQETIMYLLVYLRHPNHGHGTHHKNMDMESYMHITKLTYTMSRLKL